MGRRSAIFLQLEERDLGLTLGGNLLAADRKTLEAQLCAQQGGKCFISEQPIDLTLDEIDIDHIIPTRGRYGWPYAEPAGAPTGRTADCEITLSSAPTPTGFSARRRDGRHVSVVYDFAVGKTLPSLTTGSRLRLVDAVVAAEEGKTLEIRAWSECYLL